MIPDIETHKDYEQAMLYRDNLWHELNKPRCALCESNRKASALNSCRKFRLSLCTKTTCQEFAHDIPF